MAASIVDGHSSPDSPDETRRAGDRRLGEILVRDGFMSPVQLDEALGLQQSARTYKPLGQLLVEHGVLTQRQLNSVLDRFSKRSRLGDMLVRAGAITESQLTLALEHQRTSGMRLGEVLLKLGIVTEHSLKHALCLQLGLPHTKVGSGVLLAFEDFEHGGLAQELPPAIRLQSHAEVFGKSTGTAPAGNRKDVKDPRGAGVSGVVDKTSADQQEKVAGALARLRAEHESLSRERDRTIELIERILRRLQS